MIESKSMNEYESTRTDNYAEQRAKMSELSITDLVKAFDYINELSALVPPNNEILNDLESVIKPLREIIRELRVDESCPRCRGDLFKSDLPQYDYVCANCDENF